MLSLLLIMPSNLTTKHFLGSGSLKKGGGVTAAQCQTISFTRPICNTTSGLSGSFGAGLHYITLSGSQTVILSRQPAQCASPPHYLPIPHTNENHFPVVKSNMIFICPPIESRNGCSATGLLGGGCTLGVPGGKGFYRRLAGGQ